MGEPLNEIELFHPQVVCLLAVQGCCKEYRITYIKCYAFKKSLNNKGLSLVLSPPPFFIVHLFFSFVSFLLLGSSKASHSVFLSKVLVSLQHPQAYTSAYSRNNVSVCLLRIWPEGLLHLIGGQHRGCSWSVDFIHWAILIDCPPKLHTCGLVLHITSVICCPLYYSFWHC